MRFLVGANLVFARLYVLPAGRVLPAKRAITRIVPTALDACDAAIPTIFIVRGARRSPPGMGVPMKVLHSLHTRFGSTMERLGARDLNAKCLAIKGALDCDVTVVHWVRASSNVFAGSRSLPSKSNRNVRSSRLSPRRSHGVLTEAEHFHGALCLSMHGSGYKVERRGGTVGLSSPAERGILILGLWSHIGMTERPAGKPAPTTRLFPWLPGPAWESVLFRLRAENSVFRCYRVGNSSISRDVRLC